MEQGLLGTIGLVIMIYGIIRAATEGQKRWGSNPEGAGLLIAGLGYQLLFLNGIVLPLLLSGILIAALLVWQLKQRMVLDDAFSITAIIITLIKTTSFLFTLGVI